VSIKTFLKFFITLIISAVIFLFALIIELLFIAKYQVVYVIAIFALSVFLIVKFWKNHKPLSLAMATSLICVTFLGAIIHAAIHQYNQYRDKPYLTASFIVEKMYEKANAKPPHNNNRGYMSGIAPPIPDPFKGRWWDDPREYYNGELFTSIPDPNPYSYHQTSGL